MTATRCLQEVLFVAHFAPNPALTMLNMANWYLSVADDFPVNQEVPAWEPVHWFPQPVFMVFPQQRLPRIQGYSEDQRLSLTIQQDRIAFGWRRLEPTGEETSYPGFDHLMPVALDWIDNFRTWWAGAVGSPLVFHLCELNYMNALPFGAKGVERVSEIFKFITPSEARPIGNLTASWFEVAENAATPARVQCTNAMGATQDAPEAAIFNFAGMGLPGEDSSRTGLQSLYEVLHELTGRAFSSAINRNVLTRHDDIH